MAAKQQTGKGPKRDPRPEIEIVTDERELGTIRQRIEQEHNQPRVSLDEVLKRHGLEPVEVDD